MAETATAPPADRRQRFARADLADAALAGAVEAAAFVAPRAMAVAEAVLDMRLKPDAGARLDNQLVYGERVAVAEIADGWAWLQAAADGRVGYVRAAGLVAADGLPAPTHRVLPPGTHLYPAAAVKAPGARWLPAPAAVAVLDHVPAEGTSGSFARLAGDAGFVPSARLAPVDPPATDWVAEAERYRGTPYLWGGRSGAGVDCSSLIQLAMAAAGMACLRDSDQQAAAGWPALPEGAARARGDLVFWRGHVGVMVDATHLLHANAAHMATVVEPLAEVERRIAATEASRITATCRPGCARLGS